MVSRNRSLVGRESEIGAIDSVLDQLDRGEQIALAVEGDPGIGKTSLLAELRCRGEDRGHVVLHGAAPEFETDLPFEVVVDAFDAYLAALDEELTVAWPTELLAELGAVFPSLRDRHGAAPTGSDERFRAHRAVRSLLERLAADRPLMVILDDVHWADDASLELIQGLLRRPAEAAVVLAMGLRLGQAPPRLRAALAAPAVERIALGPLSKQVAAELLANEATPREVNRIIEQSGGNPFYLEQLSRAGSDGQSASASADESGIPAAIVASVAEEVAALPADARSLLQSAAIAGEPFEPDVAADIAELGQDEALATLDRLLEADLIRSTELPRRFSFRHPLVRRAVYENVPAGTRLAVHGRAAAALASRGAPAIAYAHHVEQAGQQGDEEAISVLLDAGRASANRAPVAAARWFAAALRLLPASDTAQQISVRCLLAQALRSCGRLEPCRAVLLEAIESIKEDADPTRIELTTRCAAVERWLGRDREAHDRLVRAWEGLPGGDSVGSASCRSS